MASRAEINHISLGFCQRDKISTKEENAAGTIANSTTEILRITEYPFTINIEWYTEKMNLEAKKQTYDLI